MLSFALRIVWLVFAALGVPATWFVLIPFASAIGTYWASVLYCITVTLLEVSFCLGMIWRMIPSNMPHWFCVVQTVIIALCFHILTGVCGCFTWASYLTVFKPYRSIQASASALLWRRAYYLFVVAFPLLAFTAHLTAVLKTDSVHPANAMHCDNTSPLWPRLLGYAGAPIVLFTPCFVLSVVTALRIVRMHAELRHLRAQEAQQNQAIHAVENGFRMAASRRSAASPSSVVTDKLRPPTLDGRTRMTVDVRLHHSSSRSSSHVSLPLSQGSAETGPSIPPFPPFPVDLPAISPLGIPASYLSEHSPPPLTQSPSLPDVDRGRSPSPIIFAHASVPSVHHSHIQLGATEVPCLNCCAFPDGAALPSQAAVSGDAQPLASPASPSRSPISLEFGERIPGFHLPTRSPPNCLRPSLELSVEYVRARFEEEDGVVLSGRLETVPALPLSPSPYSSSSYCPTLSMAGGRSPDIVGSLPSITYTDHDHALELERLPEVNEAGAEKGCVMKSGGCDFAEGECKTVSVELAEPRLKPERQFYRSPLRPSGGRPPGLHPAIWRMVVFQLVFFFILILASLSTLIDLVKDRTAVAFGTQHVSILLVAWCPAIVFGWLPGTRTPFLPRFLTRYYA